MRATLFALLVFVLPADLAGQYARAVSSPEDAAEMSRRVVAALTVDLPLPKLTRDSVLALYTQAAVETHMLRTDVSGDFDTCARAWRIYRLELRRDSVVTQLIPPGETRRVFEGRLDRYRPKRSPSAIDPACRPD
jgi:hypothetical protein